MSPALQLPEPEEAPEPDACPWCGEDCGGLCPEARDDEARDAADLRWKLELEEAR